MSEIDNNASRVSDTSAQNNDTTGVVISTAVDTDGAPLPEPPQQKPRRRSISKDGDPPAVHEGTGLKPRRRSSSGSKEPKLVDIVTDRKPAVEFVPPVEGTPAAEALAANKMIKVSKVTKGFHKIRGMKRPKMKNFNIVKKLNKTTKTKRKKKHFSKNFKGKVIDGVHELYTLTAGIMLGIRCTVGNALYTASAVTVPDFTSVSKLAFPPGGSTEGPVPTPAHDLAHTFKFKSYAPKVFHRLREFFDISAAAYMDSVCGDYNFIEFISNSKSGQFFFYSHDGQYMLKTQTKEENKFMIRILPHYYQYLTENPHSLLVRILGMHRIKMYHLRRKVHFVVMTSVFDTPAQINTIYDLKGSLVGRSATQKERENGGVLKDNDLISDKRKLHFGSKKAAFMAQLEKDAMFLAKLNIMDYSLLVGIHDRRLRTRDTLVVPGGRDSSLSAPPAGVSSPAPAAAGLSTGSDSGHVVPPTPPVHIHTHSNTPFRRASANSDLGTALAAAGVGAGAAGEVPAIPFPIGSPGGTTRKKRTSTIKSAAAADGHGSDTEHQHIRSNVSRSASLGEDPAPRTLYPGQGANGVSTATVGSNASANAHDHSHGVAPESEADEETEGEEEEEGDGEAEEGDDEESEESEFEDMDAGDSDEEGERTTAATGGSNSNTSAVTLGELVVEDGVGALGAEGFKLSEMLRPDAVVNEKDKAAAAAAAAAPAVGRQSSVSDATSVYTYGPGQARRHPWTSRKDEGINSRTADGKRGDEIYYLGVIDILQQYNANKRIETIAKGLTNDVSQISSVHPKKYARRFVQFMDANID